MVQVDAIDAAEEREILEAAHAEGAAGFFPDYNRIFSEKNEELVVLVHQLDVSTRGPEMVKEQIDGYLEQTQKVYQEILDELTQIDATIPAPLPKETSAFSDEHLNYLHGVIAGLDPSLTTVSQEITHNLSLLPHYHRVASEIAPSPSILDASKSLGRTAIDLMSQFDVHHDTMISDNIDKTKVRNKQLSTIQEQLSYMYELRASGQEIDRDLFEAKYNEARDILAEFTGDLEDIREYVELPELDEDFLPTEEGIRSFCQKLELMKIRAQGSISDLANEMHKFVQVYTIIIDIMKNMLEMDRNEREAIIRRTGQ